MLGTQDLSHGCQAARTQPHCLASCLDVLKPCLQLPVPHPLSVFSASKALLSPPAWDGPEVNTQKPRVPRELKLIGEEQGFSSFSTCNSETSLPQMPREVTYRCL